MTTTDTTIASTTITPAPTATASVNSSRTGPRLTKAITQRLTVYIEQQVSARVWATLNRACGGDCASITSKLPHPFDTAPDARLEVRARHGHESSRVEVRPYGSATDFLRISVPEPTTAGEKHGDVIITLYITDAKQGIGRGTLEAFLRAVTKWLGLTGAPLVVAVSVLATAQATLTLDPDGLRMDAGIQSLVRTPSNPSAFRSVFAPTEKP